MMNEKNKEIVEVTYSPFIIPHSAFIIVETDEDYVRACRQLSTKEASTSGLKVWVRSKNHFAWLRDFIEQIGCPAFFSEKTPRLVLAEKWNVVLPDWLTDAEVLDQGLLNIDIDVEPQAEQTSFSSRLLVYLLGPVFQQDVFDADDLVDVIKALVSTEAEAAFKEYPILRRALKSKCETWRQNSKETWVKNFCSRLFEKTGDLWQWLSLWACLHGYPEKLLEYVLAPEQVLFVRDIPVSSVHDLPLESAAREQILTQLSLLFGEIQNQVTFGEEFRKVLGWTSGRLIEEYHFISKILGSRQFSPTTEDVQEVQAKFRHCPGVSESSLNSLRHYIEPTRPGLIGPDEKWDSAEWIRWTAEEYTPYRSWQIYNNHYDEELERAVARFSDWFIEEYTAIHKDPNLSLAHCLADISSNGSEKQLSIILLVDCLPLEFEGLLDNALRKVGYNRHDLRYRFAALPTITEYNKPVLVSGRWQHDPGNYDAILKARAQADWNNAKVIYLNNLKALSELPVPQESAVVLLNFLDGDELLHSDVESKGTSYDEELHRLFARMAASVDRISREWAGAMENFSVYVVTDHGACRILEEEKQSFDSSVVSKLFPEEKHRFAVLDEKQVGEIPDNLWELGYQFKQPYVPDNRVFFLPRGHNTVRQSGKAKGYMHGGVTPEEVVVPTALYKLAKAPWKAPAARFLDLDLIRETGRAKFYIQRVVTLKIEIQNSNTVDIRVLRASVASPETDLKSCDVGFIPAGSVNTVQMNCYFKKAALGEKNLEIEVTYEISSEQHTLILTLECEFKSAMAGGFNLREL
jgi:hypothetical protein